MVACGCACGMSRRFSRARAIISSDTSTPWISPKCSRHRLHQSSGSAADFECSPGSAIRVGRQSDAIPIAGHRRSLLLSRRTRHCPVRVARMRHSSARLRGLDDSSRPHLLGRHLLVLANGSLDSVALQVDPGAAAMHRSAILNPDTNSPLFYFPARCRALGALAEIDAGLENLRLLGVVHAAELQCDSLQPARLRRSRLLLLIVCPWPMTKIPPNLARKSCC